MAKKEINKIKIKSTGKTYLVKPDGYDALYNAVLALCDIYCISKPSWRPPVEENDNSTGGNDPGTGSNTGGNDPGTGSNTGGNDPGTDALTLTLTILPEDVRPLAICKWYSDESLDNQYVIGNSNQLTLTVAAAQELRYVWFKVTASGYQDVSMKVVAYKASNPTENREITVRLIQL